MTTDHDEYEEEDEIDDGGVSNHLVARFLDRAYSLTVNDVLADLPAEGRVDDEMKSMARAFLARSEGEKHKADLTDTLVKEEGVSRPEAQQAAKALYDTMKKILPEYAHAMG